MEKTLSQEERIRRAEEIYYRRRLNNGDIRMSSAQVKDGTEKKQISLFKKMIIQILICILIYLVFSLIKEANYMFSESVTNKVKDFLNQDINFQAISTNITAFFETNKDKFSFLTNMFKENEESNEEEENPSEKGQEKGNQNGNEQTQNSEMKNEQTENINNEQTNTEVQGTENQAKINEQATENVGIGGATENEETITLSASGSSEKTQMQIDAEYIKANFSLMLPAKAVITSRYGKRKPTEIISENHQGIDIGVPTGTEIVAAMEGIVSVVSNEGSYGTHIKIENKDVTTIYAHCSKILVKEKEKIKKGQKIALSGNTGNTTGPHLHFEIRRGERTVNPELILNWG